MAAFIHILQTHIPSDEVGDRMRWKLGPNEEFETQVFLLWVEGIFIFYLPLESNRESFIGTLFDWSRFWCKSLPMFLDSLSSCT